MLPGYTDTHTHPTNCCIWTTKMLGVIEKISATVSHQCMTKQQIGPNSNWTTQSLRYILTTHEDR